MRSTFLFGLAAMAIAANAQTVQNIPNEEPLKIDGDYSVIEIATLPEDGSEPKARFKETDGIIQFDNMSNGDIALLKLNNTVTSPYILKFEEGCKIDGTTINFSLINEGGDVAWSTEYHPANNNKNWSSFAQSMLFIEDPIEAGEYTFKIEFLNEAGGTTSTANLREFYFEARESIISYSLYTYVEPGDEAGRVVLNPNQNAYLEDSEVILTATANSGYKFEKWEIDGEFYEENPYTLIVTNTSDIYAYFTALKMDNDVPGWIDLETRAGNAGKLEQKSCTLDGESYEEGASVNLLGDYRNGNKETFELNVLEDGNYEFTVAYASKPGDADEPKLVFDIYDKDVYGTEDAVAEWSATLDCKEGYGNWAKFKTAVLDNVDLTKGNKILQITFIEENSNKYTVNILKMGFSLNGDFGTSGVENVMIQQPTVRKAYNVLGVEVDPETKGFIIFSDGKKVFNK